MLKLIPLLLLLCGELCAQSVQSFPASPRRKPIYLILGQDSFKMHRIVGEKYNESALGNTVAAVEIFNWLIPGTSVRSVNHAIPKEYKFFGRADSLLITLSVLSGNYNTIDWVKISPDTIPKEFQISIKNMIKDGSSRIVNYQIMGNPATNRLTRRNDVIPVVKHNRDYFIPVSSTYVLTEYFLVRPKSTKYPTEGNNVTINVKGKFFSQDSLSNTINISEKQGNKSPYIRFTLSGKYLLDSKNDGLYKFWCFLPGISHPDMLDYGICDFLYKPRIGIISGQYGTFFANSYTGPFTDMFDVISIDQKLVK